MEGQGKLTSSSGDVYTGEFQNGLKQGQGKMFFKATGDIYEGEFNNDKATGQGKYTFALECKTYVGRLVEGMPFGYGEMTALNFTYKGFFKSGLFEGKGTFEDLVN